MAESAGWSSLPSDLVHRIADCLLATNDVDYYMDLRAVCSTWRRATDDPKNNPDPRFRPSRWIVIDEVRYSLPVQRSTPLLVNTATGRVLRKDLPMLRGYFLVATTPGGFFVLADRNPPHAACILNPFTGYLIRFMAPMITDLKFKTPAAAVTGSAPTLVLFCDEDRTMHTADPDTGSFTVYGDEYPYKRLGLLGMIYIGNDVGNKIFDLMASFNVHPSEMLPVYPFDDFGLPLETRHTDRCFLVESAGEMLMIFKLQQRMEIFKIDNGRSAPEPVKSVGNRAIFLGYRQCLSVNADKFQSVEANCIYYIKCVDSCLSIYKYDLNDEKEERISGAINSLNHVWLRDADPPFTIIQLLSSYTISADDSNRFEGVPDDTIIPYGEDFNFFSSFLEDLEFEDD
jgi:hypothetical protein